MQACFYKTTGPLQPRITFISSSDTLKQNCDPLREMFILFQVVYIFCAQWRIVSYLSLLDPL